MRAGGLGGWTFGFALSCLVSTLLHPLPLPNPLPGLPEVQGRACRAGRQVGEAFQPRVGTGENAQAVATHRTPDRLHPSRLKPRGVWSRTSEQERALRRALRGRKAPTSPADPHSACGAALLPGRAVCPAPSPPLGMTSRGYSTASQPGQVPGARACHAIFPVSQADPSKHRGPATRRHLILPHFSDQAAEARRAGHGSPELAPRSPAPVTDPRKPDFAAQSKPNQPHRAGMEKLGEDRPPEG